MNMKPEILNDYQFPKTIDEFLDLFFRRKRMFFIPFFSVLALVAVSYPWLPRYYKATALVQVGEELISNPLNNINRGSFDLANKIKSIEVQLLSWTNATDLLKKIGVVTEESSPRQLASLVRNLKSSLMLDLETDNIMRVTFIDRSPESAELYANSIAHDLEENSREAKQEEARNAIRFIQDQLRIYKGELESSEGRYIVNQTRTELAEAIKQRELIERSLDRNPVAIKMRNELMESEVQLNKLLLTAKESHPMVQDLRYKIANLKKRISREDPTGQMEGAEELPSEGLRYRDELLRKAKELDIKINAQREKLGYAEQVGVRQNNVSEQELRSIERNKKVNEDIYKSLLQRLENAHIDHRLSQLSQNSIFKILEPARIPHEPSSPNAVKVGLFALLIAILCGVAAVFVTEYFDRSIHDVKDAKNHIDLPYLGFIPRFNPHPFKRGLSFGSNGKNDPFGFSVKDGNHGIAPEIAAYHDPESQASEHVRLLRTTLFNQTRVRPLKSLLVTSSLKGEGKSTTAINLAVSVASDTNLRVVIVDGDLRAGRLAGMVGASSEPGLSEFLQGTANMEQIIRNIPSCSLSAIPAGKHLLNPTKFFSNDRFPNLLQTLRSRFDFIVLDTPPTLGISDVPSLASYVDGILFVVQVGKPWRQDIQSAAAILQDTQKNNLVGYILTHVQSEAPAYRGAYFYGAYR